MRAYGIRTRTRDENDISDSRIYGLLDKILNDRLVDDGQEFFGYRLRRRQEPSPEPRNGDDRFFHVHKNGLLSNTLSH